MAATASLRRRGVAASLDLFGERERDVERADRVAAAYGWFRYTMRRVAEAQGA